MSEPNPNPSQLLARLAATLKGHHEWATEHSAGRAVEHRTAQAEAWEAELRDVLAPIVAHLRGVDGLDPVALQVLDWIDAPQHQVQLLSVVFAVYPIVAGFVNALLTPWVSAATQLAWKHDTNLPLSPGEAARAVLFGAVSEEYGISEAGKSGMSADRFRVLTASNGDPPNPTQLMEMFRRGIIDAGLLHKGLVQGPFRIEWFPYLEKLTEQILSPEEAVAAAVQNQLPYAEAEHIAGLSGVQPKDFKVLYDTHGMPPGLMEMIGLWRRGIVDEHTVRAVIAEGHTKNKYADALVHLKERLPEPRQVPMLVREGVFTHDEGVLTLVHLGFTDKVARAMVNASGAATRSGHKAVAATQVEQAVASGRMSEAAAKERLTKLGYVPADAQLVLEIAADRRAEQLRAPALTYARGRYLSHVLDETDVRALLAKVGVPHAELDQLLALWTAERDAVHAHLTPAQVLNAWKWDVIQHEECLARLLRLGYVEADARILMAIERHAPKFQGE